MNSYFIRTLLLILTVLMLVGLSGYLKSLSEFPIISVHAVVETVPTTHLKDGDDPCIWIHPTDPALSTVIVTDKKQGIAVYDLDGDEIQFISDVNPNNIDNRYKFPLGEEKIDLVTATNCSDNSILLYRVNPETRRLEPVLPYSLTTTMTDIYGLCMYHGPGDQFYVFVTSEEGAVQQWQLTNSGNDLIQGTMVREFQLRSKAEGCVADDELGAVFIAEEKKGIWKFNVDPKSDQIGSLIAETNQNLLPDIEGLTIFYGNRHGTGYLIASSQGSDTFLVYDRAGNHDLVARFQINDTDTIDGVFHTDGIDVVNYDLGVKFPFGMFVAQDGANRDGDRTNFKFVSWSSLRSTTILHQVPKWNPRKKR